MNKIGNNRIPVTDKSRNSKRVLFVWDGSKGSIEVADRLLGEMSNYSVSVIHVLPHEAFYSYCTVGVPFENASPVERKITRSFERFVERTENLSTTKCEFLFGDRIFEISRMAEITKAELVLISPFVQSAFSEWIHGNLNSMIKEKLNCKVQFIETSDSNELPTGNRLKAESEVETEDQTN